MYNIKMIIRKAGKILLGFEGDKKEYQEALESYLNSVKTFRRFVYNDKSLVGYVEMTKDGKILNNLIRGL